MRPWWCVWMLGCSAPSVDPPDPVDSPVDSETAPPIDSAPPVDPLLTVGPERACADPSLRATLGPYTEPLAPGDWATQIVDPGAATLFQGGGVTATDLTGDGEVDVVLPGIAAPQLLLGTAEGLFTDVTATHLPAADSSRAVSATPGDPDGDGDLDLYLARYNQPDQYWQNQGDGQFVDATASIGLDPLTRTRTTTATWVDYDGDLDLDLFVGAFGPFFVAGRPPGDPSQLWENLGDGTFADRSELLPEPVQQGYVFVGGWYDLDGDGDRDLYTVNDFGHVFPNVLAWNDGGSFRVDDGSAGLHLAVQGMGLSWGDLNADGLVDLVVADWANNAVLLGQPGGRWFEAADLLGLQPDATRDQVVGWATVLADLDNDGDLDLVEGFGHIFNQPTPPAQPDEIYVQQPDGTFRPEGAAWGFSHPGQTRGVLALDLNHDGWLDLLRRDLTGPATLQLARCGAEAWTTVRLQADPPNRFAVGAELSLTVGGRTYRRTVLAGGESVLSTGPTDLHVGLGDASQIDRLEVRWPDGRRSELFDLPTRRLLTLHAPRLR